MDRAAVRPAGGLPRAGGADRRGCAGWRGAFRPVTVNGRSNQLSGFCGWPCEGSGGNGRKVPQTKDYPVSHGKASKEENNGWKNG